MPRPTFGFNPITREEFYENMNFQLSKPEIEGKPIERDSSAFLYFMGIDLTDERPENDIRALDPNLGVECGQGSVDITNCEKSAANRGMYIVSFSGIVPTPTGAAEAEFQAIINQQGAIQTSKDFALAAGYFTDTDPSADLSRVALDRLILEIDDWKLNR